MACVVCEQPHRTGHALVAIDEPPEGALVEFGREWAPRVEQVRPGVIVLDASGFTRLFGSSERWARELAQAARTRGWQVRVAVAATRVSALLIALGRAGVTVVPAGEEAAILATLPLRVLAVLETFEGHTPPPSSQARATSGATPATLRVAAPQARRSGAGRHDRRAPSPNSAVAEERGSKGQTTARGLLETCERWGVCTVGDLAALPEADVVARVGEAGRRWHRWARGRDIQPLVDVGTARRYEATCELEWPIDGLEPLSFVVARLLEPLCAELRREERGAAVVQTALSLVSKVTHDRTLQLPAPMNDPKVLRTLILLDLEASPPGAGVDRVTVRLEPLPGRRVQYSLFRRPLPAPDQVATLMARLHALMGEGRCGSPRLVDTHRPGVFTVAAFAPDETDRRTGRLSPGVAAPPASSEARDGGQPHAVLRRFRHPVGVEVAMTGGRPSGVSGRDERVSGGVVEECAGPWRTSGAWWHARAWSRDEWDVAIGGGPIYRMSRAHATNRWVIEGVWD